MKKPDFEYTEAKLLQLKEDIDKAKAKISELKGKEAYLLQELKEKFGCSSVDEAKNKLGILQNEMETASSKLDKLILDIRKAHKLE